MSIQQLRLHASMVLCEVVDMARVSDCYREGLKRLAVRLRVDLRLRHGDTLCWLYFAYVMIFWRWTSFVFEGLMLGAEAQVAWRRISH